MKNQLFDLKIKWHKKVNKFKITINKKGFFELSFGVTKITKLIKPEMEMLKQDIDKALKEYYYTRVSKPLTKKDKKFYKQHEKIWGKFSPSKKYNKELIKE